MNVDGSCIKNQRTCEKPINKGIHIYLFVFSIGNGVQTILLFPRSKRASYGEDIFTPRTFKS